MLGITTHKESRELERGITNTFSAVKTQGNISWPVLLTHNLLISKLKESMIEEVKEGLMTIFHQIKTVNKKIKTTRKNQTEILEPKGIC